jgi:hypothetical protein
MVSTANSPSAVGVARGTTYVVLQNLSANGAMVVSFVILASVMAGVLISVQTVLYSKYLLPLYVGIGAVVYLLIFRLEKAINANDIDLLERYLGGKLSAVVALSKFLLPPAES